MLRIRQDTAMPLCADHPNRDLPQRERCHCCPKVMMSMLMCLRLRAGQGRAPHVPEQTRVDLDYTPILPRPRIHTSTCSPIPTLLLIKICPPWLTMTVPSSHPDAGFPPQPWLPSPVVLSGAMPRTSLAWLRKLLQSSGEGGMIRDGS